MIRTKRCVFCLHAPAEQWFGHVRMGDTEIIAGWCKLHGREKRRSRIMDNNAKDHAPAEGFVGHYRSEMGFGDAA